MRPIPASVDKLSILARPAERGEAEGAARRGKSHGTELAPGIRRIDPRLAERLELVADHFRKAGQPPRIVLVVAEVARSAGSYHASGRAIDFRIDGVDNEALVAFCKTLQDTGCGYYPNSSFVHIDVRDAGAGHVAWIDVSKPGEAPKYVSAWPLPADAAKSAKTEAPKVDVAKAEAPEAPKVEVAKAESPKAEPSTGRPTTKSRKLPALPAAADARADGLLRARRPPPSRPRPRDTTGTTGSPGPSHTI